MCADPTGPNEAPLGEALEPLVSVVDEYPVLVTRLALLHWGWSRQLEVHVGEVVEVAGVIYGLNLDRDRCGPLPDVLPVHALNNNKGIVSFIV